MMLHGLACVLAALAAAAPARAQFAPEQRLTLGVTQYAHGSAVAGALTRAPGLPGDCAETEVCGVPGVSVTALQADNAASLAEQLSAGALELAIIPGYVAYAAVCADKVSKFSHPFTNLRVLGGLYVEVVHLVAAPGSGIAKPEDLAGKRVALGASGTGQRIIATLVLNGFGVSTSQVSNTLLMPEQAAAALAAGQLDAFFSTGPFPDPLVARLVAEGKAYLVPVDSAPGAALAKARPYLVTGAIPEGVYAGQPTIPTLGAYALLMAREGLDAGLAWRLTRALWRPANRQSMAEIAGSRPYANLRRLAQGLPGTYHPGARRYYQESGQTMAEIPCAP